MDVRSVTAQDDFAAIGNIYAASWKAAYRGIVPQGYLDELSGSRWSPILANSNYQAFVVMDGDTYAGTASVCQARDGKMAGWGEIISLYLLPKYFGMGYAEPLLHCALGALAGRGFDRVYLWVLAQNLRARRFYEKQGFAPNGDATTVEIGGKRLREVRYVKRL